MNKLLLNYLCVALAGALGTVTRFAVGSWLNAPGRPLGTLLINVTGSFILGWFLTLADQRLAISDTWRLAIGVGFVGAYTTFSTYMFESDRMVRDGQWLRAAAYLAGSLFLGLVAVRLGYIVAKQM